LNLEVVPTRVILAITGPLRHPYASEKRYSMVAVHAKTAKCSRLCCTKPCFSPKLRRRGWAIVACQRQAKNEATCASPIRNHAASRIRTSTTIVPPINWRTGLFALRTVARSTEYPGYMHAVTRVDGLVVSIVADRPAH